MNFQRIAVYCGSRAGNNPIYTEAAIELGRELAANNITLVYGAGNVGLMKKVADSVLENKGQVWGVIPRKLIDLELAHPNLTECFVTESMSERKMMMSQLSDAFIAMPGGFGTLEEIAEVTTLTQLNYHDKPVGLLNTKGYFNALVEWIGHANDEGFIRDAHRGLLCSSDSPQELLKQLRNAQFPKIEDHL